MNNPEHILVDVFKEIVTATQTTLQLANLNYRYGYIKELNETLVQDSKMDDTAVKKYPLVWLRQPFIINRNVGGFYGSVDNFSVFILQDTDKNMKAAERMTTTFKPIIYPIYRELLNQINSHPAIVHEYERPHRIVDRYYWGDAQANEVSDVLDCLEISNMKLIIDNNQNYICP